MKIKPQGAYILVKPVKAQEQSTKSGIIVDSPDTKPKQTICEVIDMGKGITLPDGTVTQFPCKKKDKVLIKGYAGDVITDEDGEEYLFILNSDILAIIE